MYTPRNRGYRSYVYRINGVDPGSGCTVGFLPLTITRLPPPIYVSLGVGPKPFERLVRLSGHLQLADLYRRVAVLRDVVLYPERLCRPGMFCTIQRLVDEWLGGDEQRENSYLETHDPPKE